MAVNKDVLRIVDANFNRSREGLRVCEDIVRFILNSSALTGELKAVRHGISGIINSSSDVARGLINSRDVPSDVGKVPNFEVEVPRRKANDIFTANIERAKESVRVLEEFFKIIDTKLSIRLTQLRFRLYAIEKKAAKKLLSL